MNRLQCASLVFCVVAPSALACTSPPVITPPTVWFETLGFNSATGKIDVRVGQQVSLFAPMSPTGCACGVGVGTGTAPAPASLSASQVVVAVVDTVTHAFTPLAEFSPLAFNPATSSAIASGPGAPSGAWFGFAGLINPFTPPSLGPNEVVKILFTLSVAPSEFNQLLQTTVAFGGGESDANGIPLFTGQHAFGFFQPTDNAIPAPGALALASLALTLASARRRR